MSKRLWRGQYIATMVLALNLAGCSVFPNMGPSTHAILGAANPVGGKDRKERSPYSVLDVNDRVVLAMESYRDNGLKASFGLNGPAASDMLGVGDVIGVSIYEASSGGLFGSGDLGTGVGTKNVQLPPQQIGRDGTISIPFAGQIRASGRTPSQVGQAITGALSSKAVEPQIIVSRVENNSSTVSVAGEVGQGGRVSLSLGGDRVLDAIAAAGGPKAGAQDIEVRLTRGSATGVIRLGDLVANPPENVYLRPGDQIFLYNSPKSFVMLGASGNNSTIPFGSAKLTLVEAIGKGGGLDDMRSDATGVFLFRYEDACVLAELFSRTCTDQGKVVPVVYRLNMRQPKSLLLAQRFFIRDKDVLYISGTLSGGLQKFLQLIGTGVGVGMATSNVVR